MMSCNGSYDICWISHYCFSSLTKAYPDINVEVHTRFCTWGVFDIYFYFSSKLAIQPLTISFKDFSRLIQTSGLYLWSFTFLLFHCVLVCLYHFNPQEPTRVFKLWKKTWEHKSLAMPVTRRIIVSICSQMWLGFYVCFYVCWLSRGGYRSANTLNIGVHSFSAIRLLQASVFGQRFLAMRTHFHFGACGRSVLVVVFLFWPGRGRPIGVMTSRQE